MRLLKATRLGHRNSEGVPRGIGFDRILDSPVGAHEKKRRSLAHTQRPHEVRPRMAGEGNDGHAPIGLRGESGGYLVSSDRFAFKTFPRKSIDIDLTRQRITLLVAG